MAKFEFTEPAGFGCPAVEVFVSNPDQVHVTLGLEGHDDFVSLSYWQLERIVRRVRGEFAFQLDREQMERLKAEGRPCACGDDTKPGLHSWSCCSGFTLPFP
jgi:hypothetical protein